MSKQDENSENEPRQIGIGPGERLQAARIKKGLSLEDVAKRMHLSSAILEAIEENDFDEITAPIFVKGYLRAYARIVALNEDEMIQQYVDFYSDEDPPIGSTSNMAPELTATDARIKWTTYLVIVVLAVLLGAWWWNKQQTEEVPISLDSQAPEVAAAGEQGMVDSNIQAGSESPVGGETAAVETVEPVQTTEPAEPAEAEAPTGQGVPAAAEPEALNAEADGGIEVDSEPPAAPETASAGQPDMSAQAETAAAEVTPEPEAAAAQAVAGTRLQPVRIAPVGSDKMQITVNADTWADVKDANNYQLLYDLLRADSIVEVSGEAPFAVFLGNGHGVEILFNGEEIGFSSRIRNDNTARINVGG